MLLAPRAHHSCSPALPSSLAACLAAVAILATDCGHRNLWAEAGPRRVKVVGWAVAEGETQLPGEAPLPSTSAFAHRRLLGTGEEACVSQGSSQSGGDGHQQPSCLFVVLNMGLGPLHLTFQSNLRAVPRSGDFTDEEN